MQKHKNQLNINFKNYFFKYNKRALKKYIKMFKNYSFKYSFIKNLLLKKKKEYKNIDNNIKYFNSQKMLLEYKYCVLIIKSFYSNFIISLMTNKGKLILNYSTGQFVSSNMKKKKLSLVTILIMIRKVIKYLKKKNIKYICVHLRTQINNYIFNIFNVLNLNKIKIIYLLFNKPIPHHFGQRKKKTRRL